MRVQLGKDEGAVAALVAILAVILVGMAAFAVDVGGAVVAKRQLSTAADAASLAAAQYIGQNATSNCASLAADMKAAAETVAVSYLKDNAPAGTVLLSGSDGFDVTCDLNTGDPIVTVGNTVATRTIFGGVFGVSTITTSRSATAAVGPTSSWGGVLPLAVCVAYLGPTVSNGDTITVYFPKGQLPTACGDLNGDWYKLDLPSLAPNHGQDSWVTNVLNGGCNCTVTIGGTLSTLPGAGGNEKKNGENLATLYGRVVLLPVFKATPDKNGKTQMTITGVIAGNLCSVRFGGTTQDGNTCTPVIDTNDDDSLSIVVTNYMQSGTINPACRFGDSTCDYGVRTTQLIR